jgi:hypothetical protein
MPVQVRIQVPVRNVSASPVQVPVRVLGVQMSLNWPGTRTTAGLLLRLQKAPGGSGLELGSGSGTGLGLGE